MRDKDMTKKKVVGNEIDYLWDALNVICKWTNSEGFNAQPMYDEINLLRLEAKKFRKIHYVIPKKIWIAVKIDFYV